MLNHRLIPLLFFLILISCNPLKTQHGDGLSLTNTHWELISFHDIFQGSTDVQSGEYTIFFSDTGTVQSKVDCNQCFGEFTLGNRKSISIQLQACTEIACLDSKDNDFHDAIKNTTRYAIHGYRLRLYYGYNYLEFINQSP